MILTPQADLDEREERRVRRVHWYCGFPERNLVGHLYEFCTDVLDYDALSQSFHGPLLAAWDAVDLKRFRQHEGWQDYQDEALDAIDEWPREHIKTWCERARVLRYYVWNPGTTVTWWHAVEAKAFESGDAIAKTILTNEKYRALFLPRILPARNAVKFFTAGKFTLKGQRIGDGPSLLCQGAGGEGTGGHSLVGVMDDIIGLNDVLDSQMPKKKQWYQGTVCNVVLKKNQVQPRRGWKDCICTPWSEDDAYVDLTTSPDWIYTNRACLETDGKPDENGEPVYLTMAEINKQRREQGALFPYQMMCDRSPKAQLIWDRSYERIVSQQEWYRGGRGLRVVVSDPAPVNVGGADPTNMKQRGDGSKDEWAIAVGEIRVRGGIQELALCDLEASRDWTPAEGFTRMCEASRRWNAPYVFMETKGSQLVHLEPELDRVRSKLGVSFNYEPLEATYRGKNLQFGLLAGRGKLGEVYMFNTIPGEELSALLAQMRKWRGLPGGKNGLRFDDRANVFSFLLDPAVMKYAPRAEAAEDPYDDEGVPYESPRGRYWAY